MINKLIAAILPLMPKRLVWIFSKKYIAGENLNDAIRIIKEFNSQNTQATIDILGESQSQKDEILKFQEQYLQAIDQVAHEKLKTTFSIKPSMFGIQNDFTFCFNTIHSIIERAAFSDIEVTIDMEDSSMTSEELKLFELLYTDFPGHTGIVVQAYLKRTLNDLIWLNQISHRNHPVNVRLCKGIYIEPAAIAYKSKTEVNRNYLKCLEYMLGNNFFPAIATHDKFVIEKALELLKKQSILPYQYEFQMLYGVTPHQREMLVANGHAMRVYVPYGSNWFKYSTRRLKENPKMVRDILGALFKRS